MLFKNFAANKKEKILVKNSDFTTKVGFCKELRIETRTNKSIVTNFSIMNDQYLNQYRTEIRFRKIVKLNK